MLILAELIPDTILEDQTDILINAFEVQSGFKADLYPLYKLIYFGPSQQ